MIQKDIYLFPKQLEFFQRTERNVLFDAGIGAGKTKSGTLWLITQALKYPGTRWYMVSRDHKQLIKSADVELRLNLELCGLKQGVHFDRKQSPGLTYTFKNGSTIEGGSSINYDSIFRGPSVSGGLFDEVDYWSKKAFDTALGRVRVYPEKIRCLSSPKGFNFIYDYFYKEKSTNRYVIQASAFDNPLLSDEYIQDLKETYGDKLFRQEVMGERLNLSANNAFYEFDNKKHIQPITQDHNQPIYIGMDFNVQHHSAAVFQYYDKKFHFFDEVRIEDDSDTYKMSARIKARYGTNVKVIPDSTGKSRSTKGISDFTILKNEGFPILYLHNPHVIDRTLNANRILSQGRMLVDPKCKFLIKDLNNVAWTNSGKLDQITDNSLTHMTDAATYGLWLLDPIKSNIPVGPIKFY